MFVWGKWCGTPYYVVFLSFILILLMARHGINQKELSAHSYTRTPQGSLQHNTHVLPFDDSTSTIEERDSHSVLDARGIPH